MKKLTLFMIVGVFFSASIWAEDKAGSWAIAQSAPVAAKAPVEDAAPVLADNSSVSSTKVVSEAAAAPVVPVVEPAAEAADASNNNLPLANERAIEITSNMKVESQTKQQQDETMHYKIEVSYPQIKGENLSASAKQFNRVIDSMVNEEMNHFKKLVTMDMPHMKTLPQDIQRNSLKVDYDLDVVKPKNNTIVSVRLSTEGMQAGRAHPYHNNRVVNFDLTSGKILTLNDLFKKNSQFLKLLAAYSNKSLNEKLKKDNWMVEQGTKADPKNFKNWNLQADSLLITFDEYQVAPYVYGKQEVEVPYSALVKILADKTPISDCAKNSVNCQVG